MVGHVGAEAPTHMMCLFIMSKLPHSERHFINLA